MLNTEQLLDVVTPYTLCSPGKLKNLLRICQYLNESGIVGDFVECGTAKGGSAAILSQALTDHRHLWLYDSFAGMPETTARDGEEAKKWIGKCLATPADVQEVMELVGTSSNSYTICPGWFEHSFTQTLPQSVALLHCDADWYKSVTLVLETFYPFIPLGGCIVLDDFGYWEGCREAFYDFCERHGEKPLVERVERDQAYWIKGKTDNRPTELPMSTSKDLTPLEHLLIEQWHQDYRYGQIQLELEECRSMLRQNDNK